MAFENRVVRACAQRLQLKLYLEKSAPRFGQAMVTWIHCKLYLFYSITPIVIAVVADSPLGRYTTVVLSTILYCLGCLVLTARSGPRNLEHGWGTPGLAVAIVLVGLGGGGFRAIMVPIIVDE